MRTTIYRLYATWESAFAAAAKLPHYAGGSWCPASSFPDAALKTIVWCPYPITGA